MPINTYARILLHTHAFKLMKKRWITLSLLVLALTQSTTAQTLLIQSGLSASRFSNTPQHEFTTKPTIALGFEYLHKKYLDVSTNIGFISRYNAFNSIDYFSESYIRTVDGISSLTFNTIADIKIPIGHSAFL